MTPVASAARWAAIAIAVAAIVDPSVSLPTRARPGLRVLGDSKEMMAAVSQDLSDAGFALHEPQDEAATVFIGAAPTWAVHPPLPVEFGRASAGQATPVWVLDTTPVAPNVRVIQATGPNLRLPGQAVDVRVVLDARGVAGKTSEIVLEDAGIRVASTRHEWKSDGERWQGSLQYLPPAAAAGRLRVRAVDISGETSTDDNAAEIAVPPMRGGIRTLVVEAGVTWPAIFVRRALEGEPAFAVAAVQRASSRIATRTGAPPAALTRGTLAAFEVALVGAPANLTDGDVEALRWFVEERGGVAVLIPDQPPSARVAALLGTPVFEPRALENAATLGHGLMSSEFVVTRSLPPGAQVLASASGEPVVFSARRGAGAVIFSGALDAWKFRGDAFTQFWRRVIADEAATVPPLLEVTVEPPLVAIGAPARLRARLRATELLPTTDAIEIESVAARAVNPAAHVDEALRLWPTAEPGVYEGEWRPSIAGDYDLAVTAGPHRGDAAVTVVSSQPEVADPEGLALIARASGGRVFRADQSPLLVDELKKAFPARTVRATLNLMRSPWWVVPFAGLLCVEWALRRKRGLP
jgi:hypothetical protein